MKRWLVTVTALMAACGGKAVVDGQPGSGGAQSSSSSNGGAGPTTNVAIVNAGPGPGVGGSSMLSCNDFARDLREALAAASACDTCDDGPDECEYFSGMELTDACKCPVAVNINRPDLSDAAFAALDRWRDSGCELDCQQPCGVSNDPQCFGNGPGCVGSCGF